MTLFEKLKLCKSEEDVKDAYIKALGLKGYHKGLIDLQTDEVWFEAKDGYKTSTYAMFTQALQARNESGDFAPTSFDAFNTAYKALTEKLQPMVYELGFLRG